VRFAIDMRKKKEISNKNNFNCSSSYLQIAFGNWVAVVRVPNIFFVQNYLLKIDSLLPSTLTCCIINLFC